jgi:hypothetical protein
MAKTSLMVKAQRKPKFKVRGYKSVAIFADALAHLLGVLDVSSLFPQKGPPW